MLLAPLAVDGSAHATVVTTTRVSLSTAGAQATKGVSVHVNGLSDDGRYVVMTSRAAQLVSGDTNGAADVFVGDTVGGTTERESVSSAEAQANGRSAANAIPGDARFVLFTSSATNLAPRRDTNRAADVFVRDRTLGITRRVSIRRTATGWHSSRPTRRSSRGTPTAARTCSCAAL